jgi:hypothetical protein
LILRESSAAKKSLSEARVEMRGEEMLKICQHVEERVLQNPRGDKWDAGRRARRPEQQHR